MITLRDVSALSVRVSEKTVWTFVHVEAAGGATGWGEATLQGSAAAVHREIARLAAALVGRSLGIPCDVAEIFGTRGGDIVEAAAISALDQAIWDLAAQRGKQPLAAALGAQRRTEINLYANVNRGTRNRRPEGFAARARAAVTCGFNAIKIAPFDEVTPGTRDKVADARALAAGLERIAAVRASVGPDVRLLVDCHWRLTEASAAEVLHEVEPLSLYWLECPLPEVAENFAALRRLRGIANNSGTRLAGCEMMVGQDGFRPFLDAGVYDVIMPDVKYAGGLRELLRIAEAAACQDVACAPHNPSGPIAHAHSLHLSAHLPLFPFLEFQFDESPLFFEFVDGVLPDPRSGSSALPRIAGLGLGLGLGGAAFRERLIDIDAAELLREAPP